MVGRMSYFSMSYLAIFNRAKVPVGEATCRHCGKSFAKSAPANGSYCSKQCADMRFKDETTLRKSVCGDMREYRIMKQNNKGFEAWRKVHGT